MSFYTDSENRCSTYSKYFDVSSLSRQPPLPRPASRLGRTNDCRYDPPHFFQRSGSHDTIRAGTLPFAGAVWMMVAGLCFAAVNSLSQYVSFKLGLPSTQVAFHQYLIALVCLLPWLIRHGLAPVADDQPAAAAPAAGRSRGGRHPVLAVGAGGSLCPSGRASPC